MVGRLERAVSAAKRIKPSSRDESASRSVGGFVASVVVAVGPNDRGE